MISKNMATKQLLTWSFLFMQDEVKQNKTQELQNSVIMTGIVKLFFQYKIPKIFSLHKFGT